MSAVDVGIYLCSQWGREIDHGCHIELTSSLYCEPAVLDPPEDTPMSRIYHGCVSAIFGHRKELPGNQNPGTMPLASLAK
jgi:hypothetical protein